MSNQKKAEVLRCISRGAPAQEVIDALFDEGVPRYECELWDYKLTTADDAAAFAELCRDVVSFYNSYGGYLIFGVSDDAAVRGIASFPFDEKRIKQKVRNFCGHDVVVRVESATYSNKNLVCISIPKRSAEVGVAVMSVDGPVSGNTPAFRRGNVYFRADESSQLIRDSEDMRFLSSERHHFFDAGATTTRYVPHNLPDRTMICERFIGRSDVKQELWLWLADRMSRYRVVAGPGGFGKTSAAYSFCEDVISVAPLGFMQVVWLSAKTKQFNPARDQFVSLAYSGTASDSFSDIPTLLTAIAEHLPIVDGDLDGLAEADTVQLLQDHLGQIPTFFVVDDLDSLAPDDQRRVVELAMLLGGERARFLLTTRKNYIAPSGSTTPLPGLAGDDFAEYVRVLEGRYNRTLTEGNISTLLEETSGSPLFAESIFRLLMVGERFTEALNRWKGEDGEAVRAAAFRKELEQLKFNSKRVLYAIAQFESLSAVEIRRIVELEQPQVEEALVELDQLFLLSSEQIGDEARFSVPSNIVRLLTEHRDEFIPNHKEIVRRAVQHRQQTKVRGGRSRGKDQLVGKAIAQAMTQLQTDAQSALITLKSAMRTEKASADLWMVYARCLTAVIPADIEGARKAFAKSYELGKRERVLFDKWIEFELKNDNSNAAIDVAERAKTALVPPPWDWLVQVAAAYYRRGSVRASRLESSDSSSDFATAIELLTKALRFAPESAKSSVRDALGRASKALA